MYLSINWTLRAVIKRLSLVCSTVDFGVVKCGIRIRVEPEMQIY